VDIERVNRLLSIVPMKLEKLDDFINKTHDQSDRARAENELRRYYEEAHNMLKDIISRGGSGGFERAKKKR
jgi:hypothetical protein